MSSKWLVLAVVAGFISAWTAVAVAQDASALVVIRDQHVKPSTTAQYEEAREEFIAFRAAHGFPFNMLTTISDEGIYRSVLFLPGGWEDMVAVEAWNQEHGLFAQDFWSRMVEPIDHSDVSIQRPRPELGYEPDPPRLTPEERLFLRERRYYLRQGTDGQAAQVRQAMRDLQQRHSMEDAYFVATQVTGPETPIMSVFMPRRDVTDWFTQASNNPEAMAEEFAEILDRMHSLVRKAEWVHWTVRRDLSYTAPTP